MKKILLVSAFSSALILSACSSSDVEKILADEFVTVSGQTTDMNDAPLPDVAIEGVHTIPGGLLSSITTSDADGNFSLSVIKDDAFYLRATKSTYATINTVKGALSANESNFDIGMPTVIEAQAVIILAFASATPIPNLADKAWLVVDVSDANGEVDGATIAPSPAPDAFVYTDCNGVETTSNTATEAPCPNRPGPMYIAYYDASTEITVTVGSETQTAVVRKGEVTILEFEQ